MGSGNSGNTGGGGATTGGSGTSSGASTSGGSGTSAGTGGPSGGSASGTGGSMSGGSAGGTGGPTSGSSGADAGGSTSGNSASGTSGDAGATGMSTTGGAPANTPDLIGPGGATCGATNATHGDGWMCILNYPSPGANAVGAWFDYLWAGSTCNLTFKKPSGNNASNPQICFSSTSCTGATPGAGLGLSLCDVHGVDVSTWPQMQQLISSHGLSTTGKSTFSSCNTGVKMTTIHWTVGSGSIPAGASVMFNDASDQVLGQVDNLPAGTASVTVPTSVDTTKIASIQFSFNAAKIPSWDFCLTSLKIAYQ
ncbi:MAG: hypothetical protein M3O36_13790 [Myxococcota bacterium]|nr:hypothetical protein [Myxococcota bacterium]